MSNETWVNLAAVGTGGAAGSVLRYGLVVGATSMWGRPQIGTVLANAIGCGLIAAAVVTLSHPRYASVSPATGLFIRVGLLGGLTTFSSFIAESVGLFQSPDPSAAEASPAVHAAESVAGSVAESVAGSAGADYAWIIYIAANLVLGCLAYLAVAAATRVVLGD